MGFTSLKPTFHSRSFQTRLSTAIPSPQICREGGSAVVVVHRITHCGDAKVGSQPSMLKQIRQRTRTREPWGGLVSGSLQACTSGKLQPRERYLARDPELSVQDRAFAQCLLGLFKTALPTCQAEHASVV